MDCETSQQKNEPEEQVAQAFLDNYNILREENEKLKQNNQVMQAEVYTLSEELKKLQLVNKNAEVDLLKEKESHKEAIWNLRNDMQKLNEERLKWKEKYLDVCMKKKDNETVAKPNNKELLDNAITDNMPEDLYANLSSAFDLGAPEDQQTDQPTSAALMETNVAGTTNQLWDPQTKRFECKDCKATFPQFSNLKAHLDKNRCVKYSFQCPQCCTVFSNATSFTKHLKHHAGKKILCAFCGDKFMHDKGLQRHIKTYHTDYNPQFTCQICAKVFNRKALLENHIRRHFDYRPFKCNACDKSFKTRQYLTGHINGVHKNERQFICDKCDARFSWRTTWKRHMQNHAHKDKKKNKKPQRTVHTNTLPSVSLENNTVDQFSPQLNFRLVTTFSKNADVQLSQLNQFHMPPLMTTPNPAPAQLSADMTSLVVDPLQLAQQTLSMNTITQNHVFSNPTDQNLDDITTSQNSSHLTQMTSLI